MANTLTRPKSTRPVLLVPAIRNSLSLNARTLSWGLVGGVMLWGAFPPLKLGGLAWPAMATWIWLARESRPYTAADYRSWYVAGFLHWLMVIHWIRLPHWSAWIGWVLLAMYLAVYVVAFAWLLRIAMQRQLPLILAAPVIWTGLELIRGRFLTGLSISLLAHTQVSMGPLIQVAELFGAYGVSFLVVLVSACVVQSVRSNNRRRLEIAPWPMVTGVLALVAVAAYGYWRLQEIKAVEVAMSADAAIRVAMIQGSIDTTFDDEDVTDQTFIEYAGLTRTALQRSPDLSLIIWPESMFPFPKVDVESPVEVPADEQHDPQRYQELLVNWQQHSAERATRFVAAVGKPMLLGKMRLQFGPHPVRRFNSVVFYNAQGQLQGSYDKMRPVMFGEYLPLGRIFPSLYRLTPMGDGLAPGTAPQAFEVNGVRFSPCICFENTIPHLLRRQYRELRESGREPDVLVTVTNDGWFWGSSLLDIHLACAVFRAIELRRPMLIAANTGFSAWINQSGSIVEQGPRRATGVLLADAGKLKPSRSVYLTMGDWPAIACAIFCGWLVLVATFDRMRRRGRRTEPLHGNTE